MNVPLITMEPETAQAKLDAYRSALKRRSDEEYAAAAAGYEALAAGYPLVVLEDAIVQGGFGEDGRPRLAIARADRRQVSVHQERRWRVSGRRYSIYFDSRTSRSRSRFPHLVHEIRVSGEQLGLHPDGPYSLTFSTGYALVPMIPADVLPKAGQLTGWHILWEVERWSDSPLLSTPDRDPLLLRRIHGDLFAVVAAWDLTELERAVMRGRSL